MYTLNNHHKPIPNSHKLKKYNPVVAIIRWTVGPYQAIKGNVTQYIDLTKTQ